jgi:phasin family protein
MASEMSEKPAAPAKAVSPEPVKTAPVAASPEPVKPPFAAAPPAVKEAPAVKSEPAPAPLAKAEPVKAAPAVAVAPAKPAPVAAAATLKRGRGRPRKSEAEKALTVALRKKALNARTKAKPVEAKPAPAPVAVKPVTIKIERKPKVTDTNFFAGLGNLPGTEQFQTAVAEANAKSREALAKSAKVAEELVDLTKANVEAVVSSSRIAAAGVQALGQDAVANSKTGMEKASAAVKSFAEAKSPTELLQLQSDYARSSFDRLVSESSKMTESFVKLLGEAIQPLSNRATANAERLNAIIA